MTQMEPELVEPILDDDYPVYGGYWYVVDGKPRRSNWNDITVAEFKRQTGAKEVRHCAVIRRKLPVFAIE